MINDIVPYTDLEAENLGRTLVKIGVPSMGPQFCMNLLTVARKLEQLIADPKLPQNGKRVLEGYKARIDDIIAVEVVMQGNIIEKLGDLIKD